MLKYFFKILSLILVVGLVYSCSIFKGGSKFKTTDSGLKYKFFEKYPGRLAPEVGKLMSLRISYQTEDSVFFNSSKISGGIMVMPMQASAFPGDFFEMMSMMHLGDSVACYLEAKSFFMETAGYQKLPDFANDLDELLFHIKIMKIQTEEEIEKEKEAKALAFKEGEAGRIDDYLKQNNISIPATESGLYVVIEKEGSGSKPQKGDKVKVHYTGTLLDGTKFDSSVDRDQPFEFLIGKGRVIKGWDEGIAMLNVGSKAKLIIPSNLAYGERGAGKQIGAYTSLIFEVELLDIIR